VTSLRSAGRPAEGTAPEPDEVIAIDGPSGAGKSSTARGVARALGFAHVDSGAFYRAAALLALRLGLADGGRVRGEALARALREVPIEAAGTEEGGGVRLDGRTVERELRSPEVAELVALVAAEPAVRRVLTAKLRKAAQGGGVVMDGRDIGTVVFPRARLKVFLDASLEERARRRSGADRRAVAAESLALRDELDRTRAEGPLVPAPDAVVLHADDLTLEEQVERIVTLYRERAAKEA
jgi:cytidylate kinase